ncbi:MAG: sugar ABC transporter substrate-binding protein [Treponema sp.]|jgi:ABC-type sugar transport system substrate-binding protein|nr:sugar ABC transporter substrate-binding protein [Treponema sp.]
MKKVLLYLLMGTVLAAGVFAGGKKDAVAAPAENTGKKVVIGYYGIDATQAFFKDVYDSLAKACKARGWELDAQFTNYDPVKMRSAYNQFKAMNVDLIIDGNAMQDIILPFAQEAADDKIPYLGLSVDLPEPSYTYGTSNPAMGKAVGSFIGKHIKEDWGGKVDLIVLVGTFTSGPQITERLTSAVPALGTFVDITGKKVVKIDADSGDTASAYQQVMDVLTANPDKKIAMFCQTDDMANSAFSAVEAAGRGHDVMGTGSDCVNIALQYFKHAVDTGDYSVPWRGSIYLGAKNYGEALCPIIQKILKGDSSVPHAILRPSDVGGIYNLYELFPELKNK